MVRLATTSRASMLRPRESLPRKYSQPYASDERCFVGEEQILFGGQVTHQRRADQRGQADEDQDQRRDGGKAVLEQEPEEAQLPVLFSALFLRGMEVRRQLLRRRALSQ